MNSSRSRRQHTWLLAAVSTVALVVGSVAFAATASADRSPQGDTHSASGQAHKAANAARHHHTTKHDGSSGASGVALPRPNGFQAQADPDGMENGGVDQPGGTGGIDLTSQDGNNGSGNDADCEDDNNGVGIPGHCKDLPGAPVTDVPDSSGTPDAGADAGSDTVATTTTVEPVVPLDDTEHVLAPSLSQTHVARSTAQGSPAAGPTVLPSTGASAALLSLALGGLVALGLGGGLLRRARRTES